MAKFKLSVASLAMLMVCGSLYAAEPAGKVLVLQGSAVAVRGQKDIPLERGALVESGDLIRVGDASSLQIRFTDEAVVALRANTQFKIDDYKFTASGEGDKSVFSLLKGGLRTITGLIGKRNTSAYSLKNETATIGIRGTHFTAVSCGGDCVNADGSKADDGLYGSVTDGRIVVSNKGGESEFGRDEFFMVAGPLVPPRGLISPPSFVRDKLDGQAKAKKEAQDKTPAGEVLAAAAPSTATLGASSSGAAGTDTTRTTISYVASDAPVAQKIVSAQAGVSTTGTTGGGISSFGLVEAVTESSIYTDSTGAYPDSWAYAWGEQMTIDTSIVHGGDYDDAAKTGGFASMADYFKAADTHSYTGDFIGSNGVPVTYSGTYSKTASVENGFDAAAGNVSWGRYHETGSQTYSDGGAHSWSGVYHWALGDAVTAAPTSGVYTYNPVGGTSPTDQNGNVGTMLSRGQFTIDFGGLTIQTSQPITWSMPTGNTYMVSVPQQNYKVNTYSQPGVAFSYITNANGMQLTASTSYTGSLMSTPQSNVGITPFGAQAQGLGVGVSTNATLSSGVQQNVSSVSIYKR